jgi:outer membrane protein OmpA-like peptidoglycan-associated protein
MRLRNINESSIDVWPAFTDFVTSVLFIVVIFVFGVFFTNIARSRIVEDMAFRNMQSQQARLKQQLNTLARFGVDVPEADGNLQRIVLRVDQKSGTGGVRFESGRAELDENGKKLLDQIVAVLERNRNDYNTIQVIGHTDAVPLGSGGIYFSNWELSAARAGAVVNYILGKKGVLEPWRFSANGRGEYQPYGIDENLMSLNPSSSPQAKTVRNAENLPGYVVDNNITSEQKGFNRRIEIILTYKLASNPASKK